MNQNTSNTNTPESHSRITYPEGQAHGVTVYVQLDDENRLYEALTDAQRRLNNERGENATSQNPHHVGDMDAAWTDGTDEVGFFSSKQEYGIETSNGFTSYYGQYLNLYDDVQDATIANNAAKRQIRVHKRSHDLVYPDGNEYTWPAGWLTGHQHEGSLIEIQASYVANPGEAIADAFAMIEATGLLPHHELSEVKQPITETVRFEGLESHHRIHANHEQDAIETLRDSARLVGNEGDGRVHGEYQKGHHQIYGVDTNAIHALGHDSSIDWEYQGDEYHDEVDKHYLKVYRHTNAEAFTFDDPRAHPKIEAKAHGAYPGPAWPAVKHQLDEILNAHVADFSGIPEAGLIADKYHDGSEQPNITTTSPSEYRINLKDYFKSTGLKKQIIGLIVNNRSDAAKDILYTIIRLGRPVSYDELTDEVGLTKRTIRKWVAKMENLSIIDREQSGCMFVTMSDFVRDHLRGFLEKMKPVGDIKRAIRRRKRNRIENREGADADATTSAKTALTDGGHDSDAVADGEAIPASERDVWPSTPTLPKPRLNPPPD